jgi:hypothetical protein
MTGTVTRVSKFGVQLNGSDKWVNLSRYEESLSLSGISKGDTVEYELNDKNYLTKIVKTSKGSSAPAESASQAPAKSGFDSAKSNAAANEKDLRITRLSVLSTAFGTPFQVLASREGADLDEVTGLVETLADRLMLYATTGKFDAPEDKQEGVK